MATIVTWCDFAREHRQCSSVDPACSIHSQSCRWFPDGSNVAVIFSDRLIKTGMVTMTSLCRHATPLHVLVLMQVTQGYQPLPDTYLNCRVLSMTLSDSLEFLRGAGWQPDSVCDGPGRDALGRVTEPTLLGALAWDKDPKHASCANHLRFYMPLFPVLARHERVLFVDDDVVVMHDPGELLRRHLRTGVLLTANCDVNLWNNSCQRFDVGRSVYKAFFEQAVVPDGAWDKVLRLLRHASNGQVAYDASHFQWNFGFNLMDLAAHRQMNFSAMYERLASSMLLKRYIRGDSLVYGLGIPFLAMSGHVECYSFSGFHVLDGLGYVPPTEMAVAGIGKEAIGAAAVLHFNGDRKPWGSNPFPEYMTAMGDWGQKLSPFYVYPKRAVPKPLKLVVLLSGPRSGTEWLAKVMADDVGVVCGSLDDRTAPHPEALMPLMVSCTDPNESPCTAWSVDPLGTDSCDLRLMCQWRYIIGAARGAFTRTSKASGKAEDGHGMGGFAHQWHAWGHDRSATEVFEGYLRRMMGLPSSAPDLPCGCQAGQEILFLKFFLNWLEPVNSSLVMPNNYQRRFIDSWNGMVSPWTSRHLVVPQNVFRRLGAKVVFIHRDPLTQYLSIQRGKMSERRGSDSSAAWHCFEADISKCNQNSEHDKSIRVDVRDAGFFIKEGLRLQQQLAGHFRPIFSSSFEDCTRNASDCIVRLYAAIGLPPRRVRVVAPRVSSSLHLIRNQREVLEMVAAVRAGNWTPPPDPKRTIRLLPQNQKRSERATPTNSRTA